MKKYEKFYVFSYKESNYHIDFANACKISTLASYCLRKQITKLSVLITFFQREVVSGMK